MLAGWSAVAAGVWAFDIVEAAEAAKATRGDAQGTAGVFAGGIEAGDAFNAFSSDFLHRLFSFLQVLIDRVHYTPKRMHCALAVD